MRLCWGAYVELGMAERASYNDVAQESDWGAKAKGRMLQFYDVLEKCLKRYRPEAYTPYMARRLRECLTTPKKLAQTPPHWILHSMEANCAYHRPGYDDCVDYNSMARVMHVYYDHLDPLQMHTVHESLDRLFLIMRREQIELQIGGSKCHLAQVWNLFVDDDPIPKTATAFERKYGLTLRQWVQLCFLSWVVVTQRPEGDWSAQPIVRYAGYTGNDDTIHAFLSHSSRSVADISTRFKTVRQTLHPMYHGLIRSAFVETPLLRLGTARIVAPHPLLMLKHAQDGLFRLAQSLPFFDNEFGRSFERYVRTILCSCQRVSKLLTDKDLKRVCRTKRCDFVLETPDAVILVECKACAYTLNLFTDTAILGHNSTKKVADALVQLHHVAKDIEDGRLQEIGIDGRKPVLGVIVTLGDIPSANSDWYFETFFLQRAAARLDPGVCCPSCMTRRPIVISAEVLQQFIISLNALQVSPFTLYDEKESQDYLAVGDWGTFLARKNANLGTNERCLAFITDQLGRFLDSFGVNPDRLI